MPKDGKKKASTDVMIDGTNISKMGPEELITYIVQSAGEMRKVKSERAFQEQERDVYFRHLEMVRNEMLKNEAEFLSKKRNIQQVQEGHHIELKVDRQRANHLKYEHSKEVKTELELQEQQDHHAAKQRFHDSEEIRDETARIQREALDERRAFEQNIKELIFKVRAEGDDVRQNYVEALADRREFFRLEREDALEEADLDLETYTRKAEQQRLENTMHLQLNFERNFYDVKRYFQELTYHNLSMIEELKTQSGNMKQHVNQLVTRLRYIQGENLKFREPMRLRQQQLDDLKKQVSLLHKDEAALFRVTKELASLKAERATLKEEIDSTRVKFEEIQTEMKSLRQNYVPAALEAKHIIGCEANVVCENTTELKQELERLKQELQVRVASGGLDAQEFLDQIEQLEQQCLDNIRIKKELQQSVDKMTKVYNDSLRTIRYLVEEYHLLVGGKIDLTPLDCGSVLAMKQSEITRLRQEKRQQQLLLKS